MPELVKVQKCPDCGCITTPLPGPDSNGYAQTMYFCGTCNHYFTREKVKWITVQGENLH